MRISSILIFRHWNLDCLIAVEFDWFKLLICSSELVRIAVCRNGDATGLLHLFLVT